MQYSYLAQGTSNAHLRVERALTCRWISHQVGDFRPHSARSMSKCFGLNKDIINNEPQVASHASDKPAPQPALPPGPPLPAAATPGIVPASAPAAASTPAINASTASSAASDEGFAKAWKPPPGEPPLWWVEKFEAKRKAEARRKADDPTFLTTQERVAGTDADAGANPVVRLLTAVLQVGQLFLVLALLLLLPASFHDGGLSLAKPYTTFAMYLVFFGLGSVARVVRYGKLAPRQQDRQVATLRGRLAFAAFVVVVPLLHLLAMYRYVGMELYTNLIPASTTVYDLVGGLGMLTAAAVNALAGRELGAAYDRVAAPAALVTSGPYRFVQHPIYTSYMMLFFSYGLWLHSAPIALAMLFVCVLYYRGRTALEARVLDEAFGSYYRDYALRTKQFVPFVV